MVEKVDHLGVVIAQLQRDNADLQDLIHPETPPKKVVEMKSVIEDLTTDLEDMEQEVKQVTDATIKFWGSVVQDEQLEQLTIEFQVDEG